MGMAEKLEELISQIQYMGGLESRLAEHLIANGVTIPVRCKDCSYWDEYHEGSLDGPGTGMGVCLEGSNWIDGKRADDFCSYGERKDHETD